MSHHNKQQHPGAATLPQSQQQPPPSQQQLHKDPYKQILASLDSTSPESLQQLQNMCHLYKTQSQKELSGGVAAGGAGATLGKGQKKLPMRMMNSAPAAASSQQNSTSGATVSSGATSAANNAHSIPNGSKNANNSAPNGNSGNGGGVQLLRPLKREGNVRKVLPLKRKADASMRRMVPLGKKAK